MKHFKKKIIHKIQEIGVGSVIFVLMLFSEQYMCVFLLFLSLRKYDDTDY